MIDLCLANAIGRNYAFITFEYDHNVKIGASVMELQLRLQVLAAVISFGFLTAVILGML